MNIQATTVTKVDLGAWEIGKLTFFSIHLTVSEHRTDAIKYV